MPESLHALVSATREDIAAMRGEITASRQATQELATQVARLAAEVVSTRRELDHHRGDDRRQMDALDRTVTQVSARQWWLAVVTVVTAAASGGGVGAAAAAQVLGGGG